MRMSPFWLLVMGILTVEFIASGKARTVFGVITRERGWFDAPGGGGGGGGD